MAIKGDKKTGLLWVSRPGKREKCAIAQVENRRI
jgi:hypothetical protein